MAGKRVQDRFRVPPTHPWLEAWCYMQKVRTLRGLGSQQASPSKAAQWGRRAISDFPSKDSVQCLPACLLGAGSKWGGGSERALSPVFSIKLSISFDKKQFFPFPSTSSPSIPSSSPFHCSPPLPLNLDSCFLHWIPNATPSHLSSSSFLSHCCS